jgi:hypothetical protein
MKTLTKTVTAYTFNELNETAGQNAKRIILEKERTSDFFTEDLIETLKEKFGLYCLTPLYSLSSCQGDGLCLNGNIYFSELFENDKFKKIAFKGIHHKQVQSVRDDFYQIDFIHKGRYCFAESVSIESIDYPSNDKKMEIAGKIMANVKSWYLSFCRQWEQRGYDYFYEISDGDMEDICKSYDYLFTQEGMLINEDEYIELAV